jgi:CubicO group peptidase (beta-lactamase class C family)
LSAHDTTAFLVVHDDAILFEEYYNGGAVDRPTFAFSMTKSFTSVLVGCAVSDGIIESVDQPVTDYVPELASAGFDEVKIEHLLQMTSGMQYRESGSPFRQHPYFYYGDDLEQRLLEQKLAAPPGTEFGYKSGENQLLGLVLDRALGEETITHYMQRRVWDPLGMEFGGSWAVDHEPGGLEKTFCCLSMTARDIAKMGRLYKNDGVWEGRRIVPVEWVRHSQIVDTSEGSAAHFQYHWWIPFADYPAFMASGHRGQYLYVNPELDLIIVRLGWSRGRLSHAEWRRFLYDLEARLGFRPADPAGSSGPVDLIAR